MLVSTEGFDDLRVSTLVRYNNDSQRIKHVSTVAISRYLRALSRQVGLYAMHVIY